MNNELKQALSATKDVRTESPVPTIFDLTLKEDRATFVGLISSGNIQQKSDDYEEQQRELFGVRNPSLVYTPDFEDTFQTYYKGLSTEQPIEEHGRWVYYPWRGVASHILPEEEYQLVHTARNRNLVTEEEQKKFYDSVIGIAGLSVGSSVAFAVALSGGGRRMKLADMDHLALSNTNRVLAGAEELGALKVYMAARKIYEINPYAELELFSDGLTEENIDRFFDGLDIVIDEIDNLALKYLIREQASARKLPIVMAADNGDNALIEVERHDLEDKPSFFHNRMGKVSYDFLKGLDKFGIGKHITKWVGADTVTIRMQDSLKELGKSLVSWPQLGIAAMINGATVAYCIRRIVNGQELTNDRALVSLDELLIPSFSSTESRAHRKKASDEFAQMFGL